MKTHLIISAVLLVTLHSFSQEVMNMDFISPSHENMIAVQRDASWGFVNTQGALKVRLRNDLVIPSQSLRELPYPYFSKGRAIIKEERNNIVYYGFIDVKGNLAIPTKYIRVTPFNEHGKAFALELFKQSLGDNDLLDKEMVRYVYNEVVIDTTGTTVYYLKEPEHILPMKDQMKESPNITSYFIADTLVAVENETGSWDIINITKQ